MHGMGREPTVSPTIRRCANLESIQELLIKAAALSSARRLQILEWLKAPHQHLGPDEPFEEREGVCGLCISEKLGISPATASLHL